MTRLVGVVCYQCGKVKGETNHWFGVRLNRDLGTIVIILFSKIPDEEVYNFEHVCGSGCLLKFVDAMAVAL